MGIGLSGLNSGLADTYSALLGGSTGGDSASTLLSDYASIKNGSYGKMMKSYYAKVKEEEDASSGTGVSKKETVDSASASAAKKFYDVASSMGSLNFSEDNMDELYDKISDYVKNYNNLITTASKSDNAAVKAQADALNDYTYQNYKLFSRIGITMNSDRTLSIDEDTFKKVDSRTHVSNIATVRSLFQGYGSVADKAADKASAIYRASGEKESITSAYASYGGSTGSISSSSSSKTEKTDESKVGTSKTAKDSASATAADTLYKSLERLGGIDHDEEHRQNIFDALSGIAEDYNTLMKNALKSENSNVIKQAEYLQDLVKNNAGTFEKFGISIDSDGKLSVDEDAFGKADMKSVDDLFNGAYSLTEKMQDRINQIYKYATQGESLANQTYTSSGGYGAASVGASLDTTL